jgi:hypothetical protein
MALTADEQKYYDFARNALPPWIKNTDEFLHGAAKMFGSVKAMIDYLFGQALIGSAVGATATTPDWLNQHARDRGTARALAESDPVLRARLRNVPDALTRAAILTAVNALLEAEGVSADASLIELPRDAAHLGVYTAMAGVGGAFVQVGTTSKFTPTTLPWPEPPFRSAAVFPVLQHQLIIAGAANAGNNGTRTITAVESDAAIVTNAGGVAGADAGVTWTVKRLDGSGNITDGFSRAYIGRGYRCCGRRLAILIILPFGATAGTEAAVRELLRTKKAAGFQTIVERRTVP